MKVTVVRYKTKTGSADENERLIKAVFGELEGKSPAGLCYVVVRLEDGTFIHLSTVEEGAAANPLIDLDAFRAFRSAVGERCVEQPQSAAAKVVGNYKVFS